MKVKPKVKVHLGEVRLFDKVAAFGTRASRRNERQGSGKAVQERPEGCFEVGERVAEGHVPDPAPRWEPGQVQGARGVRAGGAVDRQGCDEDAQDPDPIALRRIARPVRPLARTTATRSRLLHPERRHELRLQDVRRDDRVQQGARQVRASGACPRRPGTRSASPKIPRPRYKSPNYHLEVDQTRQVIFVVKNGKVRHILHTSTGAGGATRDGTFTSTGRCTATRPTVSTTPATSTG